MLLFLTTNMAAVTSRTNHSRERASQQEKKTFYKIDCDKLRTLRAEATL